MASHTLGRIAGSRQMLQRAAGGRHGRHLKERRHIRNPTPSIDAYLLGEHHAAEFYPDPI